MKFLVIQTAFLGDVILATAIIESLHRCGLAERVDVLVRKGNEAALYGHPNIGKVLVWDKGNESLRHIIRRVRSEKYQVVINIQRHFRTGLITIFSGAETTIGFATNPVSRWFTKAVPHKMDGSHEVERNHLLIADIVSDGPGRPYLYPSAQDVAMVAGYQTSPYVVIAPASVWYTKQLPVTKWIEVIKEIRLPVILIGSAEDQSLCNTIVNGANRSDVLSLAGRLSVLQSAALMREASMNYVNDSAALHMASAVNAPVTAIFCSTIPKFGFGPLSTTSTIVETPEVLPCRPCGIHGRVKCPEGHFRCATTITADQIIRH